MERVSSSREVHCSNRVCYADSLEKMSDLEEAIARFKQVKNNKISVSCCDENLYHGTE